MGLGEDVKNLGEGELQKGGDDVGNNIQKDTGGVSDSTKDTIADSGMLSRPLKLLWLD